MKQNSGTIPWTRQQLDQVDSTNRIAAEHILKRWAHGQPAHGLVIVADRQTAGRGQHRRRWESPPGGLYLSAVIENVPEIGAVRERLALVAGVAVADAIDELLGHPLARIRWPNDILLHDRKLAGILCEAVSQGPRWAAIIGIGVNVSTNLHDLPPELQSTATSLAQAIPHPPALTAVGDAILTHLGHWLSQLHRGLGPVIENVRQRDALFGRQLRFDSGADEFDATAEGIDDQGRLLLRQGERDVRPYTTGSVRRVEPRV